MTFKHVKFEDSVTMRSLERVARDKGWVHDTPISKIASLNETDLSISVNLTENIMKLCAGLRSSGLDKYADEVEFKFMNYKSAQTLYETSKETGDDLVDQAHPKGSHKLSDMDGDNVIETIIDQHLAGIKLTEKKPSGKLSSANQILSAVKFALADDNKKKQFDFYLNTIINSLKQITNIYNTEFVGRQIFHPMINTGEISYCIKLVQQAISTTNYDAVSTIKIELDSIYKSFSPAHSTIGVSDDAWSEMKPVFGQLYAAFDAARKVSSEATVTEIAGNKDSEVLKKWISNALSVLRGWQGKLSTDVDLTDVERKNAIDWITKKTNQVTSVQAQFDRLSPEEKDANAAALLSNLKKITSSFSIFKSRFID